MGFTNKIEKLKYEIGKIALEIVNHEQEKRELEIKQVNRIKCLEQWKLELEELNSNPTNIKERNNGY